jgi:tyrosine phenol-lyase
VRELYGYRHLIPAHQGWGAEHLLARVLVSPGQLVPSNLYFTTSRVHAELAGAVWTDVSISAAHGVPFILVATRITENAAFVKRREPGYEDRTLASNRPRDDGPVRRRRLLVQERPLRADQRAACSERRSRGPARARELVVVYEGFPHYGGMARHDMEALAQGIRESVDERIVDHYVGQSAYLGGLLLEAGVPVVVPLGAHAVFLDAKRFLPHLEQEQFPAQSLTAAIYLEGAGGRWSEGSSRASTGASRTTASSSCG